MTPPTFCLKGADVENAKRSFVFYQSGTWDPRVDATEADKATIFIYFGTSTRIPLLLQKQDDGCTTNWKSIGKESPSTASTILYVDKDAAVVAPDGSENAPFADINDALAEIDSRGDNVVNTQPYLIDVQGQGVYPKIVMDKSTFHDITIRGGGNVSAAGLECIVNNSNFNRFNCWGLTFTAAVDLIGDTDAGNTFATDQNFYDCIFTTKITAKNLMVLDFFGCKIDADVELENIFIGIMTGEPGMGPFQFDLNTIQANNKPAVWANGVGSVFIISGTVFLPTTVNISDDSELQIRNGVRFSNPGGTTTIGTVLATARLTCYASWIWAGTITGTGTLTVFGSFFDSSITNVAGIATVVNNNDPAAMKYIAANAANWVVPVPTDLLTAVQRIEQQVQVLTAGPIP